MSLLQGQIKMLKTVIDAVALLPFQCGDRLYTSESDVCRRQILAYKDGPRTELRHL